MGFNIDLVDLDSMSVVSASVSSKLVFRDLIDNNVNI